MAPADKMPRITAIARCVSRLSAPMPPAPGPPATP